MRAGSKKIVAELSSKRTKTWWPNKSGVKSPHLAPSRKI